VSSHVTLHVEISDPKSKSHGNLSSRDSTFYPGRVVRFRRASAPLESFRALGGLSERALQQICPYGWIWSVQRNCHIAIALITTERMKSEISGTVIFGGPFPVRTRNIQGSKIMA